MAQIPTQDLREQQAFNAFFFAPAIRPGSRVSTLFATHPPVSVRQERLADADRGDRPVDRRHPPPRSWRPAG